MLFLLFQLGNDRYALDTRQVAEVLPLVNVKQLPHAPKAVVGVFTYRGESVPLIDLSELALDRPARKRMSTRIVLVNYSGANGGTHLLGLLAEKATETLNREPADFKASGVSTDSAPYLGLVTTDEHGLVQWIEVEKLLSVPIMETLFKQTQVVAQ